MVEFLGRAWRQATCHKLRSFAWSFCLPALPACLTLQVPRFSLVGLPWPHGGERPKPGNGATLVAQNKVKNWMKRENEENFSFILGWILFIKKCTSSHLNIKTWFFIDEENANLMYRVTQQVQRIYIGHPVNIL